MRIRLAAVALALAAIPCAASAQGAAANPWSFGVSVGARLPTGDFGTATNTGFGVAGHAYLKLDQGWSLRGDLSYDTWGIKGTSASASSIGGLVNGVYDFATDGGFKPYVLAGLGLFANSLSGCGGPCPSGETKVGFGGGVGGHFDVGGQSWFTEIRYVTIQTSGGSTNFIPISVGIKF